MRERNRRIALRSAALLLAVTLATVESSAQSTPVALAMVTAGSLTLEPRVEWERARLVVGGPDGYRVEKWYSAPEPIVYSGDPSGDPLRDGFYRYELFLLDGSDRFEVHRGGLFVERGQVALASLKSGLKDNVRSELDHEPALGHGPVEPRDFTNPGDIMAGSGLAAGTTTINPNTAQLVLDFNGQASIERFLDGVSFEARDLLGGASLWLGDDGNSGFNEAVPDAPLHVWGPGGEVAIIEGGVLAVRRTDGGTPNILFSTGGQVWRFLNNATDGVFSIRDATALVSPFRVYPGGGASTLVLRNGRLGLGVTNPVYPVHHTTGARLTAGGTWANASSREAKQDIESLTAQEALAALEGLDPVKFAYRVDETDRHVGFIAEDVPELLASPDRKALAAMDVVAVLTKVVQEQERRIEDQHKQFEAELVELRELVLAQQAGSGGA